MSLIIAGKFWRSVQLQKYAEQSNFFSEAALYKARIWNVQVYQKKHWLFLLLKKHYFDLSVTTILYKITTILSLQNYFSHMKDEIFVEQFCNSTL